MSNIRAITGSTRIMNRPSGGGSKKQGIASSTNLNTWAHVAFRNRNVVCPCNRDVLFCMNQLGGVGAGGIPGRSYAFASTADGISTKLLCNINVKNINPDNFKSIFNKSKTEHSDARVRFAQIANEHKVIELCKLQSSPDNSPFSLICPDGNDPCRLLGYSFVVEFKKDGHLENISFMIIGYDNTTNKYKIKLFNNNTLNIFNQDLTVMRVFMSKTKTVV